MWKNLRVVWDGMSVRRRNAARKSRALRSASSIAGTNQSRKLHQARLSGKIYEAFAGVQRYNRLANGNFFPVRFPYCTLPAAFWVFPFAEVAPPERFAERPAMSNRLLYRLVWIPSALACVGMAYVFIRQPKPFPRPTALTLYTSGDKSVALKHPGNWKASYSNDHGVGRGIAFEPADKVRFVVVSDLAGSLMADVMKSSDTQAESIAGMMPGGAGMANLPPQKSPLEKLHISFGKAMEKSEKQYPEYHEDAYQQTRLAGVPALVSAFTFKGDTPESEICGKRYTALTLEARITVIYYCPKPMQKELSSIFTKMTESVHSGQDGGTQ